MELTHAPEAGEVLPTSPVMQELWDWALANGAKCPKLRYPVRFGAGYLGSQASERLEPSEIIISVPRTLLLNSRCAEKSEVAAVFQAHPEVFDNSDVESEDLKLITYMLAERCKGTASFWYCFLRSFGRDVEVLCDWTREEQELLQDSELVKEAGWKLEYIQTNWQALEPVLQRYSAMFLPEDLNWDTFYWLWKVIYTRVFGRYNPFSLVPLADFVNHAYCHSYYIIGEPDGSADGAPDTYILDTCYVDPETFPLPPKLADLLSLSKTALSIEEEKYSKMQEVAAEVQAALDEEEAEEVWGGPWEVDETADPVFSLRVGSKEAYEAGSQLFLFYGHYSNRQLLLHYGFTMQENLYNYARVCIPLQAMTSNASLLNQLQATGLTEAYYFRIQQYEICNSLLMQVRALAWDPVLHSPESYSRPCDLALEVAVLDKTIQLLEGELAKYPTSIEEDEALLKTVESLRAHFAVRSNLGGVSSGSEEFTEVSVLPAPSAERYPQFDFHSRKNPG